MMGALTSNLQIGKPIGKGHFGEVFLGQDDVHGPVAVKVIVKDPEQTDDQWAGQKAALIKEAQTLKKAQHPNVVEVYHLVEDDTDDAIRYVMQFCEGGSLLGPFEKGPMSLGEVRQIATEVCHGLGALHTRGMIHRDIKPSNILRDAKGVSKLGDFGLVTDDIVLGYASGAGYNDHLAPEVWAGDITSVKTDIWALGMTLYRLLHGKSWYDESPRPSHLVEAGGYADTLAWLPHIPKKWRSVIRTMLRDDPAGRYQNAQQVHNALADLHIACDWECTVEPHQVRWSRTSKGRSINVVWDRKSARKHEWTAWSEPVGAGRRKTLGGSGGVVSRAVAEKGLREFFSP